MKIFRKKRTYAVLLLVVTLILFYNTHEIGTLIYPVKYKDEIINSAARHEIDPILMAAIIRVESNFQTDKVSRKAAVGLMQIMPETAEWIIEQAKYPPAVKERLAHAEINIEAGAWYLNFLNTKFEKVMIELSDEDQIALIAAAYNAGQGNVDKWLNQNQWDGSYAHLSAIPFGETRHYVSRVLYYYKKYHQIYAKEWSA